MADFSIILWDVRRHDWNIVFLLLLSTAIKMSLPLHLSSSLSKMLWAVTCNKHGYLSKQIDYLSRISQTNFIFLKKEALIQAESKATKVYH